MKLKNEQIQYVEFLSPNITTIKEFYTKSFNWQFTDFGPEYSGFEGDYIDGGFALGPVTKGSILVILYAELLENTKEKVVAAGGTIVKDIFTFPGGRRFHFLDPDGNELAVWSDK